jgi:hypothetical protein
VVIAVVNPPGAEAMSATAVARLTTDNPAIAIRLIPALASLDIATHPVKRSDDTLRLTNPPLREFVHVLPIADALLLDMFYVHALNVAAELGVPAHFFFASAAGGSGRVPQPDVSLPHPVVVQGDGEGARVLPRHATDPHVGHAAYDAQQGERPHQGPAAPVLPHLGGHWHTGCRYPEDRVPPRTSSKSRQWLPPPG